ncbi:MAG TPA: hypothetical protein VLT86_10340 [Vicinamibacterales bacterium]|nr:hypothetical protein [Vicinamibacterales bacterium]
MADLNVRSDSVDVEQIMRQIRARIREKRGVDYTEAELQQLANVKLEKFLDPRGVRSDLVEQFRKHRVVSPAPPHFTFEDTTLYETHRGYLRAIRKLLRPFLLLFFNPNRITDALHTQAEINALNHRLFRQREELDPLVYEVIHNLVVEATRLGIEVHNLKMRVESLSSRLDFDERRGRSLESVVQYRRAAPAGDARGAGESRGPDEPRESGETRSPGGEPRSSGEPRVAAETAPRPWSEGGGGRPEGREGGGRRRRRRRRRRPGQTMGDQRGPVGSGSAGESGSPGAMRGPVDTRRPDESGGSGEAAPRSSAEAGEMRGPDDSGADDQ